MAYTSVNGTFTYTITNTSSYVFDSTDYAIIQSAFDRWDNIMTLDSRLDAGYTITISYSVEVLEAGILGGASIQNIVYIGSSETFGNTFPYEAEITLNASYLSGMKNDVRSDGKTSYYYVLLHEIGHILGIGSFWNLPGTPKVSYLDNGVTKYYYTGANALREYKSYFTDNGSSSFVGVPIEDNGEAGTVNVHPEEGPEGGVSEDNRYINGILHPGLDMELMTGWLDSSPVPTQLSRVTLGFLEDMGYNVNYNLADIYIADIYIMSWPPTIDANNLDKAYIQGFLDVSGITILRGETTVNSRVFVDGDVSINGFLRAIYPNESIPPSAIQGGVGSNTFAGDVYMDSNMTVTGDVSMNQNLSVGGDVSMNSKLTVNGITVGSGGGDLSTNSAFGHLALNANTTGRNNTAFGRLALQANTTGSSNTADGFHALYKNTTGNSNTANGSTALYSNTTGSDNCAYGREALNRNTTGFHNMANGVAALFTNDTGYYNTANGSSALFWNTTGYSNVANGFGAGSNNTTGSCNTFLGANTNISPHAADLSNSTAIGYNAKVTASNQITLGTAAETVNVPGTLDVSGVSTLRSTLNVTDATTLGSTLAVTGATTIYGTVYATNWANDTIPSTAIIGGVGSNTFAGDVSMDSNMTVTGDVSMNQNLSVGGDVSMNSKLTVNGITVGSGNGDINTNSVFGRLALNANTTGNNNTANGYGALYSNTTGNCNVANGAAALERNTTGSENIANGCDALSYNETGNYNTAN